METAEEIIEYVSNEIKGKKFIKLPIWNVFASDITYHNRFFSSIVKYNVCNFIDEIVKEKNILYQRIR